MPRARLREDLRATLTLTLALAAVAQSLLQILVFLADRFFVGHRSAAALAAMQVAGPLTRTLQSVFGAFGVGTLTVIGRAVGAGDRTPYRTAQRPGVSRRMRSSQSAAASRAPIGRLSSSLRAEKVAAASARSPVR